ncbi:MAG: Ig-like domain-containing protein [Spirochaetes bacterium]|nr:Ig-like domain-containing protein [Spirochaetota bacterium]
MKCHCLIPGLKRFIPFLIKAVLLSSGLLMAGCSIIDLRKIKIITNPKEINQIIKGDEPITVNFNSEGIRRRTAEQAVSVTAGDNGNSGSMETDFIWEGSVLTVDPVEKLVPGVHYVLIVKGLIDFDDGRSYATDIDIPFFYLTDKAKPYLETFLPEDNKACGVNGSISLTFSAGIDKNSFKDNFSISPSAEYKISWNGQTVVIKPEDKWDNLTRYTWTLTEDVTDTDGLPLAESYTHSIVVQEDASPPEVTAFYAADFTENTLTPGQDNLNYLAYHDVIYMVFTEAIDPDSLSSAFRISPDFDGTIISYRDNEYIFKPYQGWDFTTEYTLTIGTDIMDTSGNKLPEPVNIVFKPDILITPVNVIQIDGNGDNTFSLNTFNSSIPVSMDADAFGQYTFTVNFDTGYGIEYRKNIETSIQCSAYFPANSEPVRKSVVWNASGTRITIGYTGFVPSNPPHDESIYKLIIHDGTETKNAAGGYIPDDVYIYLNAE